ncbi:hypothetical protein Nmel_015983 [Mimus melanotis]
MPLGAHLVLQNKGTPKDVLMGTSRAQEQLCPYGPTKPPWVLTQLYGTSLVPTSPHRCTAGHVPPPCAHPSSLRPPHLCSPQSPAYTLVWTRQNHGTLPAGAVDFNGILTLRSVRPQDAGVYVCTGSNMLDMDQGTATLYVQGEP